MKLFLLFVTLISLITFTACTKDVGPNPDLVVIETNFCDTITFTKHIKPIIVAKCATCHISGFLNGDYTTDTYAGIKLKVDAGSFNNRVLVLHDMPQLPFSTPLPQSELDLIKCWLDAGAPNN